MNLRVQGNTQFLHWQLPSFHTTAYVALHTVGQNEASDDSGDLHLVGTSQMLCQWVNKKTLETARLATIAIPTSPHLKHARSALEYRRS